MNEETNNSPGEPSELPPTQATPPTPAWSAGASTGAAHEPLRPVSKKASTSKLGYIATFVLGLAIPSLLIIGFIGGANWQSGQAPAAANPTSNPTVAPTDQVQPNPSPSPSSSAPILEPVPVGSGDIELPEGVKGYGEPYVVGDPNASTTVSVVEDLTCPYCAQFHKSVEPVIADAVAAGKIKVKHYIVDILGPTASVNGSALGCAATQGVFSKYLDLIYDAQEKAAASQKSLSDKDLVAIGVEAGVKDKGAFETCIAEQVYIPYVSSVTEAARAANIPGTPTYFVDGVQTDPTAITEQFIAEITAS